MIGTIRGLLKRDNPLERLVYTHLAKTAGNSVTALLDDIARKYGLSSLGFGGASSGNTCAEQLRQVLAAHGLRRKYFKIILGHVPFFVSRALFPASVFTTTMRDPAWQLVSSYCSRGLNKIRADFGMSEFTARLNDASVNDEWAIDNYQTRMLCDDPCFGQPSTEAMLESAKRNLKTHYALVGFVEQLDDYFLALSAMYDIASAGSDMPVLNATGNYKPYVEPHHLEHARRFNALDVALYQWARKEFLARPSMMIVLPKERSTAYMNLWITMGTTDREDVLSEGLA